MKKLLIILSIFALCYRIGCYQSMSTIGISECREADNSLPRPDLNDTSGVFRGDYQKLIEIFYEFLMQYPYCDSYMIKSVLQIDTLKNATIFIDTISPSIARDFKKGLPQYLAQIERLVDSLPAHKQPKILGKFNMWARLHYPVDNMLYIVIASKGGYYMSDTSLNIQYKCQ